MVTINADDTTINSAPTRVENSLKVLCREFIKLFKKHRTRTIDITLAAYSLRVSKRRIYDITNVLEGLGLIEKICANNVSWVGNEQFDLFNHEFVEYDTDAADLKDVSEIEKEIELLHNEIAELAQAECNAMNIYVTPDDLKDAPVFKNKLVFLVKTDENTKLEFLDALSGNRKKLNISAGGDKIELLHIENE